MQWLGYWIGRSYWHHYWLFQIETKFHVSHYKKLRIFMAKYYIWNSNSLQKKFKGQCSQAKLITRSIIQIRLAGKKHLASNIARIFEFWHTLLLLFFSLLWTKTQLHHYDSCDMVQHNNRISLYQAKLLAFLPSYLHIRSFHVRLQVGFWPTHGSRIDNSPKPQFNY